MHDRSKNRFKYRSSWKKGHLFVFNGQTTSDLLLPKWILTICIEFDGCLWCSWGSVLSWGYHASVHFIILRASNSQGGGLGLVILECSFNGTVYHFVTIFPCHGCFSFQTRNFAGDGGACADKCIFAYCFDIWRILKVRTELIRYNWAEKVDWTNL